MDQDQNPGAIETKQQTGGANVSGADVHAGNIVGGNQYITNINQPVSNSQVHTLTSSYMHSLPLPPPDFIDRALEVEQITACLSAGVTVSSLTGLGGVGKTALALYVAAKLTDCYPDAQIMLDMQGTSDNPLTAPNAMAQVIRIFEPTADLQQASDAELAALYRGILNGKRVLLILDNARDAAQCKPLSPPRSCALLITSRRHFALPGMKPLRLDVLSPADAHRLLLTLCSRLTSSQAEQLAQLCAYLPLALRIAGSHVCVHEDLPAAAYIKQLMEHRLARLHDSDDSEQNVERIIDLSYARLTTEMQVYWRALAVFLAPFNVSAAAAVWEVDEDTARSLLSDLCHTSLVEYKVSSLPYQDSETRYWLHDLTREFANSHMTPEERNQASFRHALHYLNVASNMDAWYQKGGDGVFAGLARFDVESVHIRNGQAWAATHMDRDLETVRICEEYGNCLAHIMTIRLHPHERIAWKEAALEAARKLGNKGTEQTSLGDLGNAYRDLGEVRRAINYYEQAIEIARVIGDRQNEGNWLGNLGIAYKNLGDVRPSVSYYLQALEIVRKVGDRQGEGVWLGALASAFDRLGEWRQAITYYEQALEIARKIGDQRNEGKWLGGLGIAYQGRGQVRQAITYYGQALQIARGIGDKRNEGKWLGGLGNAYGLLGEARQAISYYEQALQIARSMANRRNEGDNLGDLGNAYADLGESQKAIACYAQALDIMREIGARRNEGLILGQLGRTVFSLGDLQKAIDYYEQALAIARTSGDRRNEGTWRSGLGAAYLNLMEVHRAIEYLDQGLTISRETNDRGSEGYALFYLSLAYGQLGALQSALDFAEASLEIREAIESPLVDETRQRVEELRTKIHEVKS